MLLGKPLAAEGTNPPLTRKRRLLGRCQKRGCEPIGTISSHVVLCLAHRLSAISLRISAHADSRIRRVYEQREDVEGGNYAARIIAKWARNEATDEELAKVRLARLPKNAPSDFGQTALANIKRVFAPQAPVPGDFK